MRRAARIATLFVPSLLAWLVVHANLHAGDVGREDPLVRAGLTALVPLFCVMAAALVVRAVEAAGTRRSTYAWSEALDILTAPGRALVWTAALATAGAAVIGWASLAVLGLCGLGVAYLMVTWAALVAAGEEPWRGVGVARAFAPSTALEGDALCEELTISGARVPAGFRLLVRGGVARHPSTLYVLDTDVSDGDISLQAELGPARRGDYEVPAAELWLQDLFGLCRSRVLRLGPGKLTVLPRPAAIDDLAAVAASRGDDADSVPAQKLPTEGCFRLRAYAPGDDARRIHWVRSLMAQELVVRLPDELPPEQPMVRLVLDTQLVGAAALPTPATGQLCDALVRVWLSAGQALVARGVRVTMVATVDEPARTVERVMTPQSAGALARVGARVCWQGALSLEAMLGDGGVRNLVVSARPRPLDGGEVTWILVPEFVWTDPEPAPLREAWTTLPYPSGAADNRWTRRRREKQTHEAMRRAGVLFDQLCQWADGPHLEGSFVARPRGARVALEAIVITRKLRDRLAAPVVVVYWLALVVGLVVYSTARVDADDLGALWAGALGGTALGQGLALRNVRGWFAAAIVGLVALVFAPMLAAGGAPAALWQALVPAALCGYWSLGERTAPAAFWFPAMTWMLTVVDRLDGDDAAATMDARAFVLLGGVAAAFLGFLWAAERRRLGLRRVVGGAPVVAGRAATLREPAGRIVARAGWWAAVAALTVSLTAWVAPHLWQSETLGGQQLTEFADGVGIGERDGVPCCPLVTGEAPRVRVREFLDVAHGVQRPPARVGVNCFACERGWGVPGGGAGVVATNAVAAAPTLPAHAPGDVAPLPSTNVPPVVPHEVQPTPPEPEVAQAPETPPTPPSEPSPAAPSPPVAPSLTPPTPHPTQAPPLVAAMRRAPRHASADASALIRLLLTLLVGAAAFVAATLTLRPLRRAVTLRHLRRPYWAETLEQRVSNLWQLTLVGLHDAGFRARAGEQPEELARRVRVDGVGACASVLERARHGLGLDDGDLASMAAAADLAYRAARTRLTVFARAAAAIRWPLA